MWADPDGPWTTKADREAEYAWYRANAIAPREPDYQEIAERINRWPDRIPGSHP